MLVACRLAGLSALEAHYASAIAHAQPHRRSWVPPPSADNAAHRRAFARGEAGFLGLRQCGLRLNGPRTVAHPPRISRVSIADKMVKLRAGAPVIRIAITAEAFEAIKADVAAEQRPL